MVMSRDRDPESGPQNPETEDTPWWADEGPGERDLPEGFPERPDLEKVRRLRQKMREDRARRQKGRKSRLMRKFDEKTGKQARDVGTYTLIPSLMLAGPAVGYGLGWLAEKQWGGSPYVGVFGILLGVAASFHQVFLLLKKNSER
jgi:F0F1-type ATP synthase assembly protein I